VGYTYADRANESLAEPEQAMAEWHWVLEEQEFQTAPIASRLSRKNMGERRRDVTGKGASFWS
jgi:hypothetical protein